MKTTLLLLTVLGLALSGCATAPADCQKPCCAKDKKCAMTDGKSCPMDKKAKM